MDYFAEIAPQLSQIGLFFKNLYYNIKNKSISLMASAKLLLNP